MKSLTRTCLAALAGLALGATSLSAQEPPVLPPINPSPSGLELPGKFIWYDLATPALSSQRDFYHDVFGWTYRSPGPSDDSYVLVMNQGRPIAGMFSAEPPGGEQDGATWIVLLSVTDVGQAVSAAGAAGGRVELGAANVPHRGRHALLRDPADALFGVLDSASGDPPDEEIQVGGIIWADLFTRDVGAMAEFYGRLAPFEARSRDMIEGSEGMLLLAHGMPRGGLVPVDEEANRSAWVPYVRVTDVQSALDRAVEGGGFVIIAPDPRLFDGNLGVFVDPNGGVMGVVRYDYEPDETS